MTWIILFLVLIVGMLGYHVYQRGFASTWQEVTALVGAIVAAILAFARSFTVPS